MPHLACQIGRDLAVRWAWLVINKHLALRPPADRSHWGGPWSASDDVVDSITLSGRSVRFCTGAAERVGELVRQHDGAGQQRAVE